MTLFMWLDIEKVGLPDHGNYPFYADRYSVPVLVANKMTGQVFEQTVVYSFEGNGWCTYGLPDGPDPSDYECPVFTHFAYLPKI